MELHGETQIIALDISKDLIESLNILPYDIPSKLCTLFKRRISVVFNGNSSQFNSINAGVPQGSVLAFTLFLLHIYDLLSSIYS